MEMHYKNESGKSKKLLQFLIEHTGASQKFHWEIESLISFHITAMSNKQK